MPHLISDVDKPAVIPVREKGGLCVLFPFVALAALTLLAYSPIMFDFFLGDDFVHLGWLQRASGDYHLVLKNFFSNWLDIPTTQFYRPLISVVMMSDYLLWGKNALGFHLTNIAYHTISSWFLYLLVLDVSRREPGRPALRASLAAALFALYPLGPEAVSWITGRVDVIVVTFVLASIWSYGRWRRCGGRVWQCASLLSMILALMSKEMAIALPAVIVIYELLINSSDFGSDERRPIAKLQSIAVATWSYWLLLLGYFIFRRFALGSFLGGYDDSFGLMHDLSQQIEIWRSSLYMWLVPVNQTLIGSESTLVLLWKALLAVAALLSLAHMLSSRRAAATGIFFITFAALSFLPVYKILSIAPDLQGSRTGYLAAVPLAAFVTAFAQGHGVKGKSWIARTRSTFSVVLGISLCIVAGLLLYKNNQAWLRAGIESNALQSSFTKLFARCPKEETLLFVGLPDNVHGAYVARNALGGLSGWQRANIGAIQAGSIFPVGYLKRAIILQPKGVKLFRWVPEQKTFALIDYSERSSDVSADEWNQRPMNERCFMSEGSTSRFDLSLRDVPPWKIDFIRLKWRSSGGDSKGTAVLEYASLYLQNRTICATVVSSGNESSVVFPLHGDIDWLTGGPIERSRVSLYGEDVREIETVEIVASENLIPALNSPGANLSTSGTLIIPEGGKEMLSVSCSGIERSAGFLLETAENQRTFSSINSPDSGGLLYQTERFDKVSASVELNRSRFPLPGLYQIRARAIDSEGNPIGLAGDHINVRID